MKVRNYSARPDFRNLLSVKGIVVKHMPINQIRAVSEISAFSERWGISETCCR